MVCPSCNLGYMIENQQAPVEKDRWVKCPSCAYTCKEKELVHYYQEEPIKRVIPRKQHIKGSD